MIALFFGVMALILLIGREECAGLLAGLLSKIGGGR